MTEHTKEVVVAAKEPALLARIRWWLRDRAEDRKKHRSLIVAVKKMRHAPEEYLREMAVPWPRSERDLLRIVRALVAREHDYGTCVYAMSIASVATFYYVSHKLGVTGFQASCAELDFIGRTRHMKHGFAVIDFGKLLYPQHREQFDKYQWDSLIEENKESLRKAANILLIENHGAHPEVLAHWERLAST